MRRILGGVLTVAVLATACSGDGDGAAPTTTTTSTTPSTTTAPATTTSTTTTTTTTAPVDGTDEEQIVAIVERFYEVIVEANNPPILNDPIWDTVATPDFADAQRSTAPANIENRLGRRHPLPETPPVVSASLAFREDHAAVLNICQQDDTIVFDLDTNEVLNDEVLFFWTQAWVESGEGGWRVDRIVRIDEFNEERLCVAAF